MSKNSTRLSQLEEALREVKEERRQILGKLGKEAARLSGELFLKIPKLAGLHEKVGMLAQEFHVLRQEEESLEEAMSQEKGAKDSLANLRLQRKELLPGNRVIFLSVGEWLVRVRPSEFSGEETVLGDRASSLPKLRRLEEKLGHLQRKVYQERQEEKKGLKKFFGDTKLTVLKAKRSMLESSREKAFISLGEDLLANSESIVMEEMGDLFAPHKDHWQEWKHTSETLQKAEEKVADLSKEVKRLRGTLSGGHERQRKEGQAKLEIAEIELGESLFRLPIEEIPGKKALSAVFEELKRLDEAAVELEKNREECQCQLARDELKQKLSIREKELETLEKVVAEKRLKVREIKERCSGMRQELTKLEKALSSE